MDVYGLVSDGNLDLIRERIAGATTGELNAADKGRRSGWNTPLHLAVRWNRVDIIGVLLDAGATIDPKDRNGYTPLLVAVERGYQDCAEELVRYGADLSACNNKGTSPLHAAADRGSAGILQTLINREADANAQDKNGNAPLHLAVSREHLEWVFVSRGHLDCIKILLPKTSVANINGHNSQGLTPLLIATKYCKIGIVKMLLAAGADPNTPSRFNLANLTSVYPLEYALMNYHEEIAVTLLQGGALPELVHGALRDMYEDFGADTREPEERKLLRKRRDMLSIMLRHGLDPAQGLSGNRYADSLLHTLCRYGAPIKDIIMLFKCDHTPSARYKNIDGDTPLMCYIKHANKLRIGVVKALLEHGADATIHDRDGRSLLSLVDKRESVPDRLRAVLVEKGAHSGHGD